MEKVHLKYNFQRNYYLHLFHKILISVQNLSALVAVLVNDLLSAHPLIFSQITMIYQDKFANVEQVRRSRMLETRCGEESV